MSLITGLGFVAPEPKRFLVQTMFQIFLTIHFVIQVHINTDMCMYLEHFYKILMTFPVFFITIKEHLSHSII